MSDSHPSVEYREIQGFPGYRVGSDGSVWSRRSRNGRGPLKDTWRKMSPVKTQGYLRVRLYPENRLQRVHRLVLEAFVGPCPPGMEACHFPDRDPSNNNLSNLKWGTQSENSSHRVLQGTAMRGSKVYTNKLTEDQVRAIRDEYAAGGISTNALARKYGVWQSNICFILKRKTWKYLD